MTVNNKEHIISFDNWPQPDWAKRISFLIENQEFAEAAELLTEDYVKSLAEKAVMPEKAFIMITAAKLFNKMHQIDKSEKIYRQLTELCPQNISILNEMAVILQQQGKINEAVKYLKSANELNPDEPAIWTNLGVNLIRLGQHQQGLALLEKAVRKLPSNNIVWSSYLLSLHYQQNIPKGLIFEKSKEWAALNSPREQFKNHKNSLASGRTLRIGYISPDFREHSVMYFFEPLLDAHSKELVELYGYAKNIIQDKTTERIKNKFKIFRDVSTLDDKATADIIYNDCIDILVDLAGHMADSGIYAMAYKPAPIQVTWLGYPNTTGLDQIDYRFTDVIADPPGSEKFYSEKLFYIEDCFLSYGPCGIAPAVAVLPFTKKGYITFGSFNNSSKINPFIIELWSRILKQVANSKIVLKFKSGQDDEVKKLFIEKFAEFGITSDRIIISGWLASPANLELYNHIDIALDTFPYNGTTTTCQALLMGVPVISLIGEQHLSRVGLSLLTNVGLEFFAASNADEYVSKAVALAAKPEALAQIRSTMRNRLAASNLCNNYGFAKKIEQAYRKMWQDYCARQRQENNITEIKMDSEKPASIKKKAKRGILYIIWGKNKKIEDMLAAAVASVQKYHPELPVHIERLETGSKITKTKMFDMSPFEETLFLDNDTKVLGRLDYGFEKASQFGMALTLNGCPLARRYRDKRLKGDMIEYSSGVIFFTPKAKAVFDAWQELFPQIDCSILHFQNNQLCLMPAADQASLAMAVEQTGFNPFVLPANWNLHPEWNRFFFGPIKIWHSSNEIPDSLLQWNKHQSDENAIIQSIQIDDASKLMTV